jgi:hypothetical protein
MKYTEGAAGLNLEFLLKRNACLGLNGSDVIVSEGGGMDDFKDGLCVLTKLCSINTTLF